MSTIAEIKRAIEKLPAGDVNALAAWLERYRISMQVEGRAPKPTERSKVCMQLAGSVEGEADLSQRKGF